MWPPSVSRAARIISASVRGSRPEFLVCGSSVGPAGCMSTTAVGGNERQNTIGRRKTKETNDANLSVVPSHFGPGASKPFSCSGQTAAGRQGAMAARANGAAERAMGDKAISRVVHQRLGDQTHTQLGRGCFVPPPGLDALEVNQAGASCSSNDSLIMLPMRCFVPPPGLDAPEVNQAGASCSSNDSFMPPMRCFVPPPGLDAPEVNQAGASCSSKDLLRKHPDRSPGLWNEGEKMTPQLHDRLTLEVDKLSRLLRELGATRGELLMWRSQELDHAFALDKAGMGGHWLPVLAAFILVTLDLIADQGDEAKRSVHEATQAVQDVIILVCCRGVTTEELGSQGMPKVLKQRLAFLFPGTCTDDRLSRLGTAKYHLFNEGVKFSRRPAKKKQ